MSGYKPFRDSEQKQPSASDDGQPANPANPANVIESQGVSNANSMLISANVSMSGYKKFGAAVDGGSEESAPEKAANPANPANPIELQGVSNANVLLMSANVSANVSLCPDQARHRDHLAVVPIGGPASLLDAPRRPPKPLCRHRWIQDGPLVRCPQCGASHPGKVKGA
jgi:hypothetical protein